MHAYLLELLLCKETVHSAFDSVAMGELGSVEGVAVHLAYPLYPARRYSLQYPRLLVSAR